MFVFHNNCILLYMMFSSAKNFRGKMTISHHKGFHVPNITNKRSAKNEMKEDQQIKIKRTIVQIFLDLYRLNWA